MDLKDDYGMFSDKGNKEIKEAIKNTLFHIYNLSEDEITGEKLHNIAWNKLYRVESHHREATDTMVREAYFITLDKKLHEFYDIEYGVFTRLKGDELKNEQ